MQKWDYIVACFPEDVEMVKDLNPTDYSDMLSTFLYEFGRDGFSVVSSFTRPERDSEIYFVLTRPGPSGDAAYRREDLDYRREELL